MDIMELTDGWLTDWGKEGGRLKEWVREVHLEAINHGLVPALLAWPGRWLRAAANAVSWLPFLWDDRDWDQAYLWRVMREKIRRMRLHHERDQVISDWERVAGEMRRAEEILTRLIEDDYAVSDWLEHERKYGSILDRTEPGPDGTRVIKSLGEEASDDLRAIADREWSLKRADAELLGKHLASSWWGWWS